MCEESLIPSLPSPCWICSWAATAAPPLLDTLTEPRLASAENRRNELAGAGAAKFTVLVVPAEMPVIGMSPRNMVKGTAGHMENDDQWNVFPAPAPRLTAHPGKLHAVASSGA